MVIYGVYTRFWPTLHIHALVLTVVCVRVCVCRHAGTNGVALALRNKETAGWHTCTLVMYVVYVTVCVCALLYT